MRLIHLLDVPELPNRHQRSSFKVSRYLQGGSAGGRRTHTRHGRLESVLQYTSCGRWREIPDVANRGNRIAQLLVGQVRRRAEAQHLAAKIGEHAGATQRFADRGGTRRANGKKAAAALV